MTDTTTTTITIYPLNIGAHSPFMPYLATYTTDPKGTSAGELFVSQPQYKREVDERNQAKMQIREALEWTDTQMRNDYGNQPWHTQVTLTLEDINNLRALLGADPFTQKKTYSFTAYLRYEISGEVTATSESAAEEYVNALLENVDDPDVSEPTIDGEWEWVSVSYSDTDDLDISEA